VFLHNFPISSVGGGVELEHAEGGEGFEDVEAGEGTAGEELGVCDADARDSGKGDWK